MLTVFKEVATKSQAKKGGKGILIPVIKTIWGGGEKMKEVMCRLGGGGGENAI